MLYFTVIYLLYFSEVSEEKHECMMSAGPLYKTETELEIYGTGSLVFMMCVETFFGDNTLCRIL
jgi:hypothetical protein